MEEIRFRMENAFTEEEGRICADLNKLMISISDYLLREEAETRKGVDEIMGGEVLELYSEKLIREGREEGIKEGIRALISTCSSLGVSREITLQRLQKEFQLSREEAERMLEIY